MGFGSYDESEQEDQEDAGLDEDDAVSVHEHDHDGEHTVEGGEDADELLDQLQEIKD